MASKQALPCWVEDAIESIDAAIFSGDTFHSTEAIAQLRKQMARWERGLKEHDEETMDFAWECNECGSQEYTMSVSDVHKVGCGSCGNSEWHKAAVK